jgi:hypothetical protein
MIPFVVVAERNGRELGRYEIQAENEADALMDGPYELAHKLKIDVFDESIRFRALRAKPAGTKGAPFATNAIGETVS